MARRPLLLLVVMVVVGLGLAVGSVVDLHKRIVRGQVCGPHERLYHVRLRIYKSKGIATCGGSLIRPEWILTAAHCVRNYVRLTAMLGVHPNPAQATEVQITAPPVIYRDANGDHDIALLRLTNPAPAGIPTIALPNCQNRLNPGDRVQMAGHASTTTLANNERNPGTVNLLHCAEFEVVGCQRLRQDLLLPQNQNMRNWLNQHWLCAQDTRRPPVVDICLGDSGGGVVDTATHTLYGVNSFTGNGDYACSQAFAFMDVCAYMGWITREIGTAPQPPRPGQSGPPPIPPRPGQSGPPPLPPRRGQSGSPPIPPRRGQSGNPPLPPRRGQSGPLPIPPRRGRPGPPPPSSGGAQPRLPSRPPSRGRPVSPPRRGRRGSPPPSPGGARPRSPSRPPSGGQSKRKKGCSNCFRG